MSKSHVNLEVLGACYFDMGGARSPSSRALIEVGLARA